VTVNTSHQRDIARISLTRHQAHLQLPATQYSSACRCGDGLRGSWRRWRRCRRPSPPSWPPTATWSWGTARRTRRRGTWPSRCTSRRSPRRRWRPRRCIPTGVGAADLAACCNLEERVLDMSLQAQPDSAAVCSRCTAELLSFRCFRCTNRSGRCPWLASTPAACAAPQVEGDGSAGGGASAGNGCGAASGHSGARSTDRPLHRGAPLPPRGQQVRRLRFTWLAPVKGQS